MPKKWHGRLEDITDLDNAKAAYWVARSTSKRKDRWNIRRFSSDIVLQALCNEIQSGHYRPQPAHVFTIVEPVNHKERIIEAPVFETKVVEQMVLNVFGTQICRFIHPYQCGSVPNRGQEFSRRIIRKWAHLPKRQKRYYVQGDVYHFFPSIEKGIAMREYYRHIGDTRVTSLIYALMPHDVGQPLGNALVQATANLVFTRLMYECVKFSKRCLSQMDDFIVLFSSKKKARKFIDHILKFARDELHLKIKTKGKSGIQVWQWQKRGINISGYVTAYNGIQKVRRHVYKALRRLMALESMSLHQARSFMSRIGLVKHTDSVRFYDKLVKAERRLDLRNIISKEDKKKYESAA